MTPRNRSATIDRLRGELAAARDEVDLLTAVADAVRDAMFAETQEGFTVALDEAFAAVEEYDLQPRPCTDCGIDTCSITADDRGEYYMVHAAIWRTATKLRPASLLCIGCLETRLGRTLTSADFTDAPVNEPHDRMSERLRSRLLAV